MRAYDRSVQAVSVIWQCLAYSNSCVNPIIYNHTSKDFRDAFRCAFSSSSRRRSESNRHLEGEAAEGSICAVSRPHLGQQRSMKEIAVAADTVVAQANLDKLLQQQPNPAAVVDRLSDCSNTVHLEDWSGKTTLSSDGMIKYWNAPTTIRQYIRFLGLRCSLVLVLVDDGHKKQSFIGCPYLWNICPDGSWSCSRTELSTTDFGNEFQELTILCEK